MGTALLVSYDASGKMRGSEVLSPGAYTLRQPETGSRLLCLLNEDYSAAALLQADR